MKLENFLTSKILNYKRYKNTVSSPIIKISIFSIIIGVVVINFSLSIGFGIQNEIKNNFKYMDIFRGFSNKDAHKTKEKNRYKDINQRFILGW